MIGCAVLTFLYLIASTIVVAFGSAAYSAAGVSLISTLIGRYYLNVVFYYNVRQWNKKWMWIYNFMLGETQWNKKITIV